MLATDHEILLHTILGSPEPQEDAVGVLGDALEEQGLWTWQHVRGLVLRHPESDAVRLLAARWCAGNGQVPRADFIRTQVELARTPKPDPPQAVGQLKSWQRRRLAELQGRESDLIRAFAWRWLRDGLPGSVYDEFDRWREKGATIHSKRQEDYSLTFRRGFIAEVRVLADDWLSGAGAVLYANNPLELVGLSGKRPQRNQWLPNRWTWQRAECFGRNPNDPHVLPVSLFSWLERALAERSYETERAAQESLSKACLMHVRTQRRAAP